jgi:hypothetical protein
MVMAISGKPDAAWMVHLSEGQEARHDGAVRPIRPRDQKCFVKPKMDDACAEANDANATGYAF